MGDYGMKVSQGGFDVKTAEDKDLVFSSKLNQLKVRLTGTAVITASTTVAHGLAYTPVFFGLHSHNGTQFKMGSGGADGTNLLLDIYTADGVYWRYYAFYHQAI